MPGDIFRVVPDAGIDLAGSITEPQIEIWFPVFPMARVFRYEKDTIGPIIFPYLLDVDPFCASFHTIMP